MKEKSIFTIIKNWLEKGEGGEWYEPYITNGDVLIFFSVGILLGFIIASAFVFII